MLRWGRKQTGDYLKPEELLRVNSVAVSAPLTAVYMLILDTLNSKDNI